MQAEPDDDRTAPAKFLDHAEAVIEHHRHNRDPYDAARSDLVQWADKHAGALNDVGFVVEFLDGSYVAIDCGTEGVSAFVRAFDPSDGSVARRIPLGPSSDRH